MSYDTWKNVNLSDIVASVSSSFNFNRNELVLVNTSDVLEGKVLNHTFTKNLQVKGQFKKAFEKDDILYSEIRPKNKRFAYIDFDPNGYVASTKLMVLRGNKDRVDNKFLYQILTSTEMINKLQQVAESRSGTFPQITFTQLGEQEVKLPPLQQQKAIANILSSLDDKIELNNKINKNLEEMAQVLYKQWFVDFEFPNEDGEPYKSSGGEMIDSEFGLIPKGWETSRIKELDLIVTDYVANGSFKSLKENVNLYEEENYAIFVRNTDLKNGIGSGVKFVDQHSYEFLSKSRLDGREVIISNVGDVGSVYRCPILKKPMTLGNNVIMLKSTNGFRYENYLYTYFSSYIGQGAIDSITGGSAQPKFNKTDFRNLKIVLPNKNTLNIFVEIVSEIYCEIDLNSNQNNILSETRDTLLPKLMSGEIEVPIKG